MVSKTTNQSHHTDQQTSCESASDSELELLKEPLSTVAIIDKGALSEPGQFSPRKKPETPPSQSPLLCLGMARTGTASLCAALNILGVDRIHHGFNIVKEDW